MVEARVVDPTQFDPASEYYDPKSEPQNPRWMAVDVCHLETFPAVITLEELRLTPGLEDMEVTKRGQRLSVMPVTQAEWEIVCRLAAK